MTLSDVSAERLLRDMFAAALDTALPATCVPGALPENDGGPAIVIGFGKAAAAMAQAVESVWRGPVSGLVVTRYGHAVACKKIHVIEAGHPVPDENSVRAAKQILELVKGLDTKRSGPMPRLRRRIGAIVVTG